MNIISTMNFEAKRLLSKKYLIEEIFIDYIILVLERTISTKDIALIIVEQVIPYVLHFNMRNSKINYYFIASRDY